MRPCQQCNAALMNCDKVCPLCGATQRPTVGLLKDPLPMSVGHPTRVDGYAIEEEERHLSLMLLGALGGFHLLLVWLIGMVTGSPVVSLFAVTILVIVEAGIVQGGLGG